MPHKLSSSIVIILIHALLLSTSSLGLEEQVEQNEKCITPFSAQSANFDRAKGITSASGDVVFCRDNFVLRADSAEWNTKQKIIKLQGKPARFEQRISEEEGVTQTYFVSLMANFIDINEAQGKGKLQGEAKLTVNRAGQRIESEAQTINFTQNKIGKLATITMIGNPASIFITSETTETVSISATKIDFDLISQTLILTGNAKLQDQQVRIAAQLLEFDIEKKSWNAPPSSDGPLTITPLDDTP